MVLQNMLGTMISTFNLNLDGGNMLENVNQ
jgi:hypothetical protein